jgi:arginyl-tRNA--protein-N-Asp/Glu arginylyltransferase
VLAYHKSLSPDSLPGKDLDHYLALGWYRMHQHIFSSTHLLAEDCWKVHWLRFPVAEIGETSTQRRIRKRNQLFKVTIEDFTGIRPEHEELYSRYRGSIDFNGALTIHQSLLDEEDASRNIFKTKCISVFDGDRLIAGGYFDLGVVSSASILHFFDPEYKRFSLGKYLMLITLDFLKSNGFEFYYPGYVIAGNPKMDYKLFLGRHAAQYFDPESEDWKPFNDTILQAETYSETDKLEVIIALLV